MKKLDLYDKYQFKHWFREKLLSADITMKSLAEILDFIYCSIKATP
jgi:hypothetical protein